MLNAESPTSYDLARELEEQCGDNLTVKSWQNGEVLIWTDGYVSEEMTAIAAEYSFRVTTADTHNDGQLSVYFQKKEEMHL